jgi:anti-sigma-K factor RskA
MGVCGAGVSDFVSARMREDPDFARVVEAWPTLSAPIKAAVLALLGAAAKA